MEKGLHFSPNYVAAFAWVNEGQIAVAPVKGNDPEMDTIEERVTQAIMEELTSEDLEYSWPLNMTQYIRTREIR